VNQLEEKVEKLIEQNKRLIEEFNMHKERLGYSFRVKQKTIGTSIESLQGDNERLKAEIEIYKKCTTAYNQMSEAGLKIDIRSPPHLFHI
jgi:hypothetical protein